MKFIVYRNDLNDALKVVARAAAVKPMTPILAGIYLCAADDNHLEIQAFDGTTRIAAVIPCKTEIPGDIILNAKHFQDFVAKLSGDMITCYVENNSLFFRSGSSHVELLTMEPEDFPKPKPFDDIVNKFTVSAPKFKDLLRKTTFAAAVDESRPIFAGVLFNINDDKLSLIATNTHRLAVASTGLVDDFTWNKYFVVPAKPLSIITNQLSDINGLVAINTDSRRVNFAFDNFTVTIRLLEGEYPPVDRVLLKDSQTQATVNAKDFKRAIELANLIAKDNEYNAVKLHFSDSGLEIFSVDANIGNATSPVDAAVTGAELTIAFSAKYLLDAFRIAGGEKINIRLNDHYSPAEFTDPDDDNAVYIVTPVRV